MDMTAIVSQLAVLFLILILGYIANKTRIMGVEANKMLTRLVLNITLPATVLDAITNVEMGITGGQVFYFLGVSTATYALAFLVAVVVPKLLRAPRSEYGLYRFMTVFANVGFMGYPVAQAVFGPQALFYVAIYNIPFNLLSYSIGILMVSSGRGKADWKVFINPTFVTTVVAVILFLLGVRLPGVVGDAAKMLGGITSPAAMLIIGSTLANLKLREMFNEPRVYPLTILRLLAMPVLTWLIFHLFVKDAMMLGLLVMQMGMPIAINATMLSLEYGGNEKLAAKAVFISTVACIVTVPLLMYIFFA